MPSPPTQSRGPRAKAGDFRIINPKNGGANALGIGRLGFVRALRENLTSGAHNRRLSSLCWSRSLAFTYARDDGRHAR